MDTASAVAWINANGIVIGIAFSAAQIATSILVPVGIEFWSKRNKPMITPKDTHPQALTTSIDTNATTVRAFDVGWFFKNAWGVLLGIPLSAWLLYWQVSQPGPVTREFVGVAVLLGLYFAFSVLAGLGFVVATVARPVATRINALSDRLGNG